MDSINHMIMVSKNTGSKENRGGKGNKKKINETESEGYSTHAHSSSLSDSESLSLLRAPVPARNCYRVTDEQSCGNELLYALLEGSRWLKPSQENIPQDG
jgi:hypothetical protein